MSIQKLNVILTIFVFSLVFSLIISIPIRNQEDNTQKHVEEMQSHIDRDFDRFVNASDYHDLSGLKSCFIQLKNLVSRARNRTRTLFAGNDLLIKMLDRLAVENNSNVLDVARMNFIRLSLWTVSSNRDNYSFYKLRAAEEWINKRLLVESLSNDLKCRMSEVRALIQMAKDSRDLQANSLIDCIQNLTRLLQNWRDKLPEIRHEIHKYQQIRDDAFVSQKNDLALYAVNELYDNFSQYV